MAGLRSIGVLVVVVVCLLFLSSESVEGLTLGGNILRVRRWCRFTRQVREVILQVFKYSSCILLLLVRLAGASGI